jgi:very-short-patch-repair endonuclease
MCQTNILKTTEQFIKESKDKYGDIYGYSKTEYIRKDNPIIIYCNKHKCYFDTTPKHHLNKHTKTGGCKECGRDRIIICNKKKTKKTIESFIEEAKEVHGNKYDYSLVEYKNMKTNVNIICKECGVFPKPPRKHLGGAGCPTCKLKEKTNTLDNFITKSKEKYGDTKFDYSLVEYKNNNTEVTIICPLHGNFEQKPRAHLAKLLEEPCAICRKDKLQNAFIEKSKIIHNNKYDYSLVDYKSAKEEVTIICPIHKEFQQTPDAHLAGKSCRQCNVPCIGKNEGEYFTPYLKSIIDEEIELQYVVKNDVSYYAVDFYLPSINVVIEYDEHHHIYRKKEDTIRQKYIEDKLGCNFIRIKDREFMKDNSYAYDVIYEQLNKIIDNTKIPL